MGLSVRYLFQAASGTFSDFWGRISLGLLEETLSFLGISGSEQFPPQHRSRFTPPARGGIPSDELPEPFDRFSVVMLSIQDNALPEHGVFRKFGASIRSMGGLKVHHRFQEPS